MKKIKLIAPILGATAVVGSTTTLFACSQKRDIELADKNVASLTVSKNDENGIECSVKAIDTTKQIASVQIKIGEQTLTDQEFIFEKEGGKITITKDILTKYAGKVIITPTIESIVKSIKLDKPTQTLDVGETFKITPTTEPAGYAVTWKSDKPEIASVDDKGNVIAKAYGEATITATAGDKTATCKATVSKYSIKFDIDKLNLYYEQESTIQATVEPEGTPISWDSSKPEVATIENGKVKAIADGDTVISGSITTPLGKTYTANCNVHVQECYITLDKQSFAISTTDTETITATVMPEGKTVTWNSTDDDIASVTNGVVTGGTKSGTATITASVGDIKAECSVENTEYSIAFDTDPINLYTGDTKQLTPTVNPVGTKVSYSSGTTSIATVDDNGLVTVQPDGNGEVTITAEITTPKGNKISANKTINVTKYGITLSKTKVELVSGETETITAATTPTSQVVSWSSDETSIASVNNGTITANSDGKAVITAKITTPSQKEITATCTVDVKQYVISLNKSSTTLCTSEEETLTASVRPSGTDVSWSSSAPTNVSVDNGKITALASNDATATITAAVTSDPTFKAECSVSVTGYSIVINKTTATLGFGEEEQLSVTSKTPEAATVVWSSDNTDVATVDSATGKVTAKSKEGTANIKATITTPAPQSKEISASCAVTVNEYSLTFNPTTMSLFVTGTTTGTLTATAKPSTASITYKITPESQNAISFDESTGVVTALAAGEATITGSITTPKGATKTASCAVTVSEAVPTTFVETDWSVIVSAAKTFEASAQDETAMRALCSTFTDVAYTSSGSSVEDHLYGFLGRTKTIEINGKAHTVRIAGINHDTIANSSTKAVFTFELVTLLSDSDGNAITSTFDTENNYDYSTSILRDNLNGGTKQVWGTPAIDLLPKVIKDNLKEVKKEVGKTKSRTITEYTDKLFPLTHDEIAGQNEDAYSLREGSRYRYYKVSYTQGYRAKKDANGNANHYWLTSPYTNATDYTWRIFDDGDVIPSTVTNSHAVSFAFCI